MPKRISNDSQQANGGEARVYRLPHRPLPAVEDAADAAAYQDCPGSVIEFPTKTAAAVDEGSQTVQEQPCPATTGDVAPGSSTRPSSTGPTSPRPSRRGHGSLGVLMPSMTITQPFTGLGNADIGSLTHALIATHAPLRDAAGYPDNLVARLNAAARALLDGSNPSRRIAIASQAVGLANRYLTTLAPVAPWRLLAVEYETGAGPVDVAWVSDDDLVLFDEVKTSTVASHAMPSHWVAQTRRYARAGAATFGARFAGARLVPVNALHLARFVPCTGPSVPLAPTTVEPLRVAGGVL